MFIVNTESIYTQMLWGSANDGIGPGDERVQHVTPNLQILAAGPHRHMKRMIGTSPKLLAIASPMIRAVRHQSTVRGAFRQIML